MICSNCKKNTATHCIGRENGDLFLCDDCYERLGAAAGLGAEPDFFVSFLGVDGKEERQCPVCGTALSDYTRTGLVGCAHCYETFREELMPSIRRIHGKTVHTGKHPQGGGALFDLLDERNRLRAELERALKEKRMKDAEQLNRDIREISRVLYRGDFGGDGDE